MTVVETARNVLGWTDADSAEFSETSAHEEIRIVNRAKWLLIERLGMKEAEARRYIEKRAMDQRVSRRKVAESVLQTYK